MISLIISILFILVGLISYFLKNVHDDKSIPRWISTLILLVGFFILLFNSYIVVDSEEVKVARIFGKIQQEVKTEGFHFVSPINDWTSMNIQRNAIEVNDGDKTPGMTSTTADNNQATVLANSNYMINPTYAWWVLKYLGDEDKFKIELLEKSAQSATRDALAHFKLEEAQIGKRTQFEQMLQKEFADNVFINLPKKELDSLELRKVFYIYPTQLMDVKPDPKVANALAEKKAVEINLEQQKTMTAIAVEVGNRKEAEGKGIRKLIDELPKTMSANDVALILNSSANKTRAEALMKAVTDGKINFGVFEGGASAVFPK